jgi:large subunit ribosomal protein L21
MISEQTNDYAVVRIGGKQELVSVGDTLEVHRLPTAEAGETVVFDQVLLIRQKDNILVGQPLLPSYRVTATVKDHKRGPKIKVFKKRRRKGFHKTIGFRAALTHIHIDAIQEI